MHFQCLIEDLSGRILVEHVMDKLKKEGYDVVNVSGGYRAYLKLSLAWYMENSLSDSHQIAGE